MRLRQTAVVQKIREISNLLHCRHMHQTRLERIRLKILKGTQTIFQYLKQNFDMVVYYCKQKFVNLATFRF